MPLNSRAEILEKFISVTNCSKRVALRYLRTAEWDIKVAANLLYEGDPPSEGEDDDNEGCKTPNYSPRPSSPEYVSAESDTDGDYSGSQVLVNTRARGPCPSPEPISLEDMPKRIDCKRSIISEAPDFDDAESDDLDKSICSDDQIDLDSNSEYVIFPWGCNLNTSGTTESSRHSSFRDNEIFSLPRFGRDRQSSSNNLPTRNSNQPSASTPTSLPPFRPVPEKICVRLYSNGFIVGNGAFRDYQNNKQFMDSIRNGEVPDELRKLASNGRSIEINVEDKTEEVYKRIEEEFQPFQGKGIALRSPKSPPSKSQSNSLPSAVETSPETSSSVDIHQLEQLAVEQLKVESISPTALRLRLPGVPTPLRIRLDCDRTLDDVRKFLIENISSLNADKFQFLEPPASKIAVETEKQSIIDLNLLNSTLIVYYTD